MGTKTNLSLDLFELNNYRNIVKYRCSCNSLRSIWDLYFCRHCMQFKCPFCVHHEIDHYYCGKCEENSAKLELKLHQNKCNSCYLCSSCGHQLSKRIIYMASSQETRSSASGTAGPTGPQEKLKTFYALCLRCRWSSRELNDAVRVVLENQPFPVRENVHDAYTDSLRKYYKNLCVYHESNTGYEYLTEKFSVSSIHVNKNRSVYNLCRQFGLETDKLKDKQQRYCQSKQQQTLGDELAEIPKFEATSELEDFPDDLFDETADGPLELLDPLDATDLSQKFLEPFYQPDSATDFRIVRQPLLVKQSQRCRNCEHFVVKPDIFSTLTKFKIQLFACAHVPIVRVCSFEKSATDSEMITAVVLEITNPTSYEMDVWLVDYAKQLDDRAVADDLLANAKKVDEFRTSSSYSAPVQQPFDRDACAGNYAIKFPCGMPIVLPAKFDSSAAVAAAAAAVATAAGGSTTGQHAKAADVAFDLDSFITFRKVNKIGLKLPLFACGADSEPDATDITFRFRVYHSFVNTIGLISLNEYPATRPASSSSGSTTATSTASLSNATATKTRKSYHEFEVFVNFPKSLILASSPSSSS